MAAERAFEQAKATRLSTIPGTSLSPLRGPVPRKYLPVDLPTSR